LGLAADAGWLPQIDWLMLKKICMELEHFEGQYLSCNVSGQTLADPHFSDRLTQLIADTFINPQQLNLEISETIAIAADRVLEQSIFSQLAALYESGNAPRLMVDDFGSAFAQLQQLRSLIKQLPPNSIYALKLDRSFVAGVQNDPTNLTLCRATIEMAHNLGLEVIAEGVETESEAITLRGLSCDYLQGYLLGKPLPIDEYLLPSQ
jgi:EAL domain-containing protein (putative c-di-GMP-specific phosphodiesterase class I)